MKYNIRFTKAVAAGNDFVIIDNKDGGIDPAAIDYPKMALDICRRKLSVGADGLLVLESSRNADFKMRVINPDGSEVDMCGNGARCSALYAASSGWGNELTLETGAGILSAKVDEENIKLKMSDPKDIDLEIKLGIGSNMMIVHRINTGVPHVIHLVDDIEKYKVVETGRKVREHTLFAPDGTNVDFIGKVVNNCASVRTYERGVEDETLACGTGAVASAIVLGLLGFAESPVSIRTQSGDVLSIYFNISGDKVTDVYLRGSAYIVCVGEI